MPPQIKIQKTKDLCLSNIYFVFGQVSRSNSMSSNINLLLKILSLSMSSLRRLAALCGVSVFALFATNFQLSAHGEPKEFKSSVPMDFDGDGDIDIVDADSSSGNLYLIRNSGLNFSKELILDPSFNADLVASADIDQDGDDDLVILNQTTGEIQVLDNSGSEVFTPLASSSLGSSINEAHIADLDNQTGSDLAYSTPTAVGWAKNNGSDGFIPQSSIQSGLSSPTALEVGDIDQDGDNDLYYGDSSIAGLGIAKNQGSETFVPQVANSTISDFSDLEIADLDGDGNDDMVYASQGASAIGWMKNDGSDNFLPASNLASGLTSVDQIQVADLDNDSDFDIVGASSLSNERAWLENDGSEGFIPHQLG